MSAKTAIKWRKENPWARFVEWARRRVRCTDPHKWWPYYGAKGVEVKLTAKDLEKVWKRDGAHSLKRPSLDRIDPAGHYEIGNVRFIEFDLNSRLAWDKNQQVPGIDESNCEFA